MQVHRVGRGGVVGRRPGSDVPSRGRQSMRSVSNDGAADVPRRGWARPLMFSGQTRSALTDGQRLVLGELLRHARLLGAAPDDVEAHDRLRRRLAAPCCAGSPSSRRRTGGSRSTTSTRSAGSSGIDVRRTGLRQQPAVAADLDHRAAVAQRERERARVGRVEEPQPVQPPLDLHPRRDRAVDQDRVAAEAAVEVDPVAERPVGVERCGPGSSAGRRSRPAAARARRRPDRRAGRTPPARRTASGAVSPCAWSWYQSVA